jgi:hypothetical protein
MRGTAILLVRGCCGRGLESGFKGLSCSWEEDDLRSFLLESLLQQVSIGQPSLRIVRTLQHVSSGLFVVIADLT